MTVKEVLSSFIKCAKEPIWREQVVIVGCNEVSELTLRILRKLGLEPKAYSSFVTTFDKKRITHTWVEVDNYVVETNPSQIMGVKYEISPVIWLPREDWESFTNPEEREPHGEHVLYVTPSGDKYYDGVAEEIARCVTLGKTMSDRPKISKVFIDRGYDRGKLHCKRCGRYMHDVDKTVDPKNLPEKVPVICRGCGVPRLVEKDEWIKACKEFDKYLLQLRADNPEVTEDRIFLGKTVEEFKYKDLDVKVVDGLTLLRDSRVYLSPVTTTEKRKTFIDLPFYQKLKELLILNEVLEHERIELYWTEERGLSREEAHKLAVSEEPLHLRPIVNRIIKELYGIRVRESGLNPSAGYDPWCWIVPAAIILGFAVLPAIWWITWSTIPSEG